MKGKIVLLSCIFLVLLSTAVLAESEGKGFYISGSTGGTWVEDTNVKFSSIGLNYDVSYDTGFHLGGSVGYDFGMFRTEGEFMYRENSFDKMNDYTLNGVVLGDISLSGNANVKSYLLNGYIDFENKSSITPYIGIGLGLADIENSDADIDDKEFAYQAAAGIGYDINKKLTLDVGYRYFAIYDDDNSGLGIYDDDDDYKSHNISFSVRYKFW